MTAPPPPPPPPPALLQSALRGRDDTHHHPHRRRTPAKEEVAGGGPPEAVDQPRRRTVPKPRLIGHRRGPRADPGGRPPGPPTDALLSYLGCDTLLAELEDGVEQVQGAVRENGTALRVAERKLEEVRHLVHASAEHAAPVDRREVYSFARLGGDRPEPAPRPDPSRLPVLPSRPQPVATSPSVMARPKVRRPGDDDDLTDARPRGRGPQRLVRLTPATSVMLRMGLKFTLPKLDARQVLAEAERAAPEPAYSPSTLGALLRSIGWVPPPSSDGGLSPSDDSRGSTGSGSGSEDDRRRAAQARRVELYEARMVRLEAAIRRREELRAMAVQLTRDRPRQLCEALRAAMWIPLVVLGRCSFLEAPRRHRAQLVLASCLLPLFRRYVWRKERRAARMFLSALGRTHVQPLTIDDLRAAGPLFSTWPDSNVRSFLRKLKLMVYRPGEVLCHKGDPSDCVYLLARGAVEVIIFRPNSVGKGRGRKSGLKVATMGPPKYVGEYGVFADEPRAATLVAQERVYCWRCSKAAFRYELGRLPLQVQLSIKRTLEANMKQIYKVRPAQLASSLLFQNWDVVTLEELVTRLEPFVFAEQEALVRQGDYGACLYIIARGRCDAVSVFPAIPGGQPVTHRVQLSSGDQLGQRGCLFVEPQPATVTAITTVQAWRLSRAALMDFMLRRPDWFLEAKQRLNQEFERLIPRPTIQHLLSCSLLPPELPPRLAERIHETCLAPRVVEGGTPVVSAGEGFRGVFLFVGGRCKVGGKQLAAGAALGVDQVVAGAKVWPETATAVTRIDAWVVDFKTLSNVLAPSGKGAAASPVLQRLQLILQRWRDPPR